MRRLAGVLVGVSLLVLAALAWDVARQMPGAGPAAVAGGLAFMLVLLGAYAFPVVLVGGLVALEAYALGHLLRRRDLAWRARLLWLAAIVVLTPWFAAGAAAYALWGRRPAASAAAPA